MDSVCLSHSSPRCGKKLCIILDRDRTFIQISLFILDHFIARFNNFLSLMCTCSLFIGTQLHSKSMIFSPSFFIAVYRRPLELSQVFTAIVQLLGNACISTSLTQQSWQHITKNYACVMKVWTLTWLYVAYTISKFEISQWTKEPWDLTEVIRDEHRIDKNILGLGPPTMSYSHVICRDGLLTLNDP